MNGLGGAGASLRSGDGCRVAVSLRHRPRDFEFGVNSCSRDGRRWTWEFLILCELAFQFILKLSFVFITSDLSDASGGVL